MRIAVLTQYFPSSAQPWQGNSAYQTVRLLAQQHDLRVFFPESRYPRPLTPRSRTHGALDPAWQPPGVPTDYLPYTALPFLSRPLNGWSIARRLLAPIRAFAPDILLSYVIYPDGYAATQIARTLGIPAVLTAIGSDLNRIPGRLVERRTRTALRDAAIVTTVSADLARTAIALGAPPERTRALLNGCDPAVFHPRDRIAARAELGAELADPTAPLLLYVGRMDIRKGLRELIDAAATLRAPHPTLHTYLVGDGPDQPDLAALAARHNLTGRVHFIPATRGPRVATWMAAADAVTLPSYNEGCPNVVVEALACGRPVVATRVGGIPELLDDTSGRLVPPHDPAALARALDDVLTQPWDAIALAGRHTRTWANVAADLDAILASAVQTSPHS